MGHRCDQNSAVDINATLRLLEPRHWPAWVIASIFWILSFLPYPWQLSIGRWIGRRLFRHAQRLRQVTEVNLKLCFSEWTADQRAHLLKKNFESFGISLLETAMGWWSADDRIRPLFTIHGIEHLQTCLRHGHGVILCSAHFFSMELAGRFLMMKLPFTVVYRPQKHEVLEFVSHRCRRRHYQQLIPQNDIRAMITALRSNRVVWLAPDIDPGPKRNGVFAPFFNVPAYSTTIMGRIARITGAPLVPVFPYRRDDGTGYDIFLDHRIEDFPTNDPIKDATRVNQIIEQAIRRRPEGYLWLYKRFKTRPQGEVNVYAK
jgi:KDO2-lipid IV(A) lauroyltransferase